MRHAAVQRLDELAEVANPLRAISLDDPGGGHIDPALLFSGGCAAEGAVPAKDDYAAGEVWLENLVCQPGREDERMRAESSAHDILTRTDGHSRTTDEVAVEHVEGHAAVHVVPKRDTRPPREAVVDFEPDLRMFIGLDDRQAVERGAGHDRYRNRQMVALRVVAHTDHERPDLEPPTDRGRSAVEVRRRVEPAESDRRPQAFAGADAEQRSERHLRIELVAGRDGEPDRAADGQQAPLPCRMCLLGLLRLDAGRLRRSRGTFS